MPDTQKDAAGKKPSSFKWIAIAVAGVLALGLAMYLVFGRDGSAIDKPRCVRALMHEPEDHVSYVNLDKLRASPIKVEQLRDEEITSALSMFKADDVAELMVATHSEVFVSMQNVLVRFKRDVSPGRPEGTTEQIQGFSCYEFAGNTPTEKRWCGMVASRTYIVTNSREELDFVLQKFKARTGKLSEIGEHALTVLGACDVFEIDAGGFDPLDSHGAVLGSATMERTCVLTFISQREAEPAEIGINEKPFDNVFFKTSRFFTQGDKVSAKRDGRYVHVTGTSKYGS